MSAAQAEYAWYELNLCNMRALYLLFFILFSESIAAITYNFTATSGTYTANSTPTIIHAANTDDALSAAINIGFTFTYDCMDYTSVKVSSNGWLTFNTSEINSDFDNNLGSASFLNMLSPLWDNLKTGPFGNVNYKLTGTSPNQVFTVEWKQMKWQNDASFSCISFQVKLYETSNQVDFIYFRESGTVTATSASIGIKGTTTTDFYSLNATSAAPIASYGTETNTLATKPVTNQIYRWTPIAMTYSSCTVTQASTAAIGYCYDANQVLRFEVVTSDCQSPLSVSQIRFNMTGTTNITGDVADARIYYTGNSSTYDNAVEFTTAPVTAAAGTLTATGSQTLVEGSNYFWITYRLKTAANTANVVDGQGVDIRVAGVNRIPATTSPAGTRAIDACTSGPGIAESISLWLKADDDVYEASGSDACENGDAVYDWMNSVPGASIPKLSQATATSRPAYYSTNASYLMNYNPVIKFDGVDDYLFNSVIGSAAFHATNNTIMMVQKLVGSVSGTNVWFKWETNQTGYSRYGFENNAGYPRFDPFSDANKILGNMNSLYNMKKIVTGISTATTGTLMTNGYTENTLNFSSTSLDNSATANLFIGANAEPTFRSYTNIELPELAVYKTTLTTLGIYKTHAYLSIKYGITLGFDYISSSNKIIFAHDPLYSANIYGIGRDDNSALIQRQSKDAVDSVRIYLSSLASTNAANTGSFSSDLSFVIAGDNNAPMHSTAASKAEKPAGIYSRIAREWKVTNTNFSGTFGMNFRLAAPATASVVASDLRLLVDDDGNFSNATVYAAGAGLTISYSAGIITITGISTTHIANNATRYITIGSASGITPLPITRLYFNAEKEEAKIKLTWITVSETNNDYYTIEKSKNAEGWEFVSNIKGAGNSNSKLNYIDYDNHPYQGISYYRLKQTDYDGKYTYSPIETINFIDQTFVWLAPNPAENKLTVFLKEELTNTRVSIFNASGSVVLLSNPDESQALQMTLDISSLQPGMYTIKIAGDRNKTVISKFVKR
jgi:hypothetical protein